MQRARVIQKQNFHLYPDGTLVEVVDRRGHNGSYLTRNLHDLVSTNDYFRPAGTMEQYVREEELVFLDEEVKA